MESEYIPSSETGYGARDKFISQFPNTLRFAKYIYGIYFLNEVGNTKFDPERAHAWGVTWADDASVVIYFKIGNVTDEIYLYTLPYEDSFIVSELKFFRRGDSISVTKSMNIDPRLNLQDTLVPEVQTINEILRQTENWDCELAPIHIQKLFTHIPEVLLFARDEWQKITTKSPVSVPFNPEMADNITIKKGSKKSYILIEFDYEGPNPYTDEIWCSFTAEKKDLVGLRLPDFVKEKIENATTGIIMFSRRIGEEFNYIIYEKERIIQLIGETEESSLYVELGYLYGVHETVFSSANAIAL